MATLTIRLPDDKHERLKELARRRNISINKLIEELSTIALAEFDAETRFRAMVAKGSISAVALLDRLDSQLTEQ
ncbi:ribbon-helix-helix protein, CopG family [Gloeocapsopsis crepidinum LEGE 06123]|uniref:Ribbon-helix-helix protein, CopG family n=1 Tax=Gloeocapsopsis crepidinum LEGE 06123 TaxID=588587 RepID=A0ABR9UKH2_9CHRO|nr:CopG family transcriptional regulator [Gloeocapsopsis crepidinum]MBE9188789.1 ribbon-helix-helix protein, CopG family [Gloeocapsopsis crepidinum LEGE 06123]